MAWFKVDDKLPDHRKARKVRKSSSTKRRDVAPFGIWTLAGAWSSDGFVPLEILQDWDDDAEELADRLVAAGMWHSTERDGEPGYVFHDWDDQNPFRDDNDPSSTGTFGNHVRWHIQRNIVDPDCGHCPSEPDDLSADDRPDIGPTSPPDIGYVGAESLPSRPVPTRPDPTRTRPDRDAVAPTETTSSDRFEEFWEVYDHKIGRKTAKAKYRLALKKPGITAEFLIHAARDYIAFQRSTGKHPDFTKNAATWLNGEYWTDERPARAAPKSNVDAHLALVRELAEAEHDQPRQIGTQP